MTTQQKAIIGAAIIIGFIFFQAKPKEALTSDQLQPIIKQTEKAFEEAEFDVFNIVPVDPDDSPLGPDPDPLKCICKGTGKIIHGDGHTTNCPYHSKSTAKTNCKNGTCTPTQNRSEIFVPQRRGFLFFRR